MRHLTDQRLQLRGNPWPSSTRLPAPEEPEALAMPAGKGLWGDNRQGVLPVAPVAEPDEGKARGVGRTPRLDVSLLIQRKLFVQKEILRGQRGTKAQAE